ncbi:HAD family hydrolase [Streptomyces sp. JHA26]|uniref:HAD family hydrolase n=1 Tax=Streptomyces sp. JHA26 TaxID=1917143 RepID=UPI00209AC543|nr:HAD family hydrolase [Streptomyces sp. JHA26]
MTSDTTRTEPVAVDTENLGRLVRGARFVLWDFDGPICRLFAGHTAERVAAGLVAWLGGRGLGDLLTEAERESPDPHAVLRAVDRRHPDGDLVAELEERLTREELRATASALPTAYADPLIRTWTAVGVRPAVATNNSPRVARTYLAGRGLLPCFGPHVYGRTRELRLLKPDPHTLVRALGAMGAAPSASLFIGDSPADCEAARLARVPFLGYARDGRKAESLRDAGADTVVDSLEPLLALLRAGGASGG